MRTLTLNPKPNLRRVSAVFNALDDVPACFGVTSVETLLKLDPGGILYRPVLPSAVVILQIIEPPLAVRSGVNFLMRVGAWSVLGLTLVVVLGLMLVVVLGLMLVVVLGLVLLLG